MTGARPPGRWSKLLSACAHAQERRFILADLEEEFEARVLDEGPTKARRWYRSQVLRSALPCLGMRLERLAKSLTWPKPALDLGSDVRVAGRSLVKTPLLGVVTVASLAFGIGAATVVFTIVNALLLRSPGITSPETFVGIATSQSDGEPHGDSSFPDYQSIQRDVTALETVAACQIDTFVFGELGAKRRILVERVTANYFDVLGVDMVQGRGFVESESAPEGSERVVVLSYHLWRAQFANDSNASADGSVIGHETILNGQRYTIIGVAPKGLLSRDGGLLPAAWVPLGAPDGSDFLKSDIRDRGDRAYGIVGRRQDGALLETVQAQLDVLAERLAASYPAKWRDELGAAHHFSALSELDSRLGPEFRRALTGASLFLLGAAGLIVLLACANVAGLFLAHAHTRRPEMAVRLSLGAPRARLMRMLFVESAVLAFAGAALGVALSSAATQRLSTLPLPLGFPLSFDFSLDLRVLVFVLLVGILATIAFGLVPALEASRVSLTSALSGSATAPRRGKLQARKVLVVAQLAASLILLAGAGLFLRAIEAAGAVDLGLDPVGIAVMSKNVPDHYDDPNVYAMEMLAELSALPEVHRAALGRSAELSFLNWRAEVQVAGYEKADAESTTFHFNSVTPGYLEMLNIPLLAGRTFTDRDTPGRTAAAVVNESFARRFWDSPTPLGEMFSVVRRHRLSGEEDAGETRFQIVGVVRDGRYPDIDEEPEPFFWTALWQDPSPSLVVHLQARPGAEDGAAQLVAVLARAIEVGDSELTLLTPTTLSRLAEIQLLKLHIPSRALAYDGIFGLVLAVIGVYGLVAFAVSAKRREIAIRMAMGAGRSRVIASMMGGVIGLAAIGFGTGVLVIFPVAQLIRSRLFGVAPLDPIALGAATGLLLLAVVAGSYLPARRAALISPSEALREQ